MTHSIPSLDSLECASRSELMQGSARSRMFSGSASFVLSSQSVRRHAHLLASGPLRRSEQCIAVFRCDKLGDGHSGLKSFDPRRSVNLRYRQEASEFLRQSIYRRAERRAM